MIDNNTYNINLKKAYKNLKRVTIFMSLEALLPTMLIIVNNNIYLKAVASVIYLAPILSILSYNYSKDELTYQQHNDLRYKKLLKYRLKHFLIPAIIYFVMSPLILIITKSVIYFTIYEILGFIVFILYNMIMNKKIKNLINDIKLNEKYE